MKIIAASIDLTKIDKSRIVTTNANGEPFKNGGKYYNISIIVKDEVDQFGNDVAIKEGQTKEEREAGEQSPFIGNGKTVYTSSPNKPSASTTPSAPTSEGIGANVSDDDLPF